MRPAPARHGGLAAAAALAAGLIAAAAAPRAQDASALAGVLERALAGMPATTGVFVKHLPSGRSAGVRADQAFSPASVIKLVFMVRAHQLADAGTLDLGRRVTLTRAHLRHGTGVLQYHEPGLSPTLRDLVTEMIITSDNTATDAVLEAIGGVEATNAWLKAAGHPDIEVFGRPDAYRRALLALIDPEFATLTAEETTGLLYTMDGNPLAALYAPLFIGERARWPAVVAAPDNRRRFAEERDRRTSSDPAFWLGRVTPQAVGRLLEAIERGTAASAAACAVMRTTLARQQLGVRRLPHFLDVPVAHKTGDGGRIANDVGIIRARSGPVVVAFFANAVREPIGEFEDRIGRLARDLVAALER
ncbi:MAG: serine hydrolase [Vicinamibacterales bacterium]